MSKINWILIGLVICLTTFVIVYVNKKVEYKDTYAQDRSMIEDLQARYMFALDWQDPEAYAATFTEDGTLDWAGGIVKGREAIRGEVRAMRANFAAQEAEDVPLRPARLRHFITNVVVNINDDKATGCAYWFEFNNRVPDRSGVSGNYGHYTDELRKVDGQWLFSSRKIWNEAMDERAASMENPVRQLIDHHTMPGDTMEGI